MATRISQPVVFVRFGWCGGSSFKRGAKYRPGRPARFYAEVLGPHDEITPGLKHIVRRTLRRKQKNKLHQATLHD